MADVTDMPTAIKSAAELNVWLSTNAPRVRAKAATGDRVARAVLVSWKSAAAMPPGNERHRLTGQVARLAAVFDWVNDPRMGTAEQFIRYNAARPLIEAIERGEDPATAANSQP